MFGERDDPHRVLPAARPGLSQRRRPLDRLPARARHRARSSPSPWRSCCSGERPGPTALAGAVLIGASALLLTGNPFAWHRSEARHAVGFALLTGFTISTVHDPDKASVAAWLIPPLVYDWGCNFFRSLVLVPFTQQARAGRHRRRPGASAARPSSRSRSCRRFPTSSCSPPWSSRR